MNKKGFDILDSEIDESNQRFVDKCLDIRAQIFHLISTHPVINTQKKLAEALGKKEPEVSRWLTGLHNLTMETITKIEAIFHQDIILTDEKAKKKYQLEAHDINIENLLINQTLIRNKRKEYAKQIHKEAYQFNEPQASYKIYKYKNNLCLGEDKSNSPHRDSSKIHAEYIFETSQGKSIKKVDTNKSSLAILLRSSFAHYEKK